MISTHIRAHVVMPEDVISEVDDAAGTGNRSAFIEEAVAEALRLERRRKFLRKFEVNPPGRWGYPGEEHMDAAEWVHLDRRRGDHIDELWADRREE